MWLVGVVRRYIDILIIIITFPYSTCISSFLAAAYIPTYLFICFFVLVYVIFVEYTKSCSKNIRDHSKIEFFASPETSIPHARTA